MIKAYIRVRPLESHEEKSPLLEFQINEVTIEAESGRIQRTLAFDKVFSESVSQKTVYKTVVRPMVDELLQGYNCTVFAYGQTGTGKTYTMTGDCVDGGDDMHAGIIPRALEHVFQQLKTLNREYTVNISYVELYNEKMRSLLDCDDDNFNIQLMDDIDGNCILKGLTLSLVKRKEDALKLLKAGMENKKTASTKMNSSSSRSHTILTIVVRIKEVVEGECDDVVRMGKLHLAGSENVSKSGASEERGGVKKRLNKMSNIIRSLLTLGRVITSITENSVHIPYRESKLTRFLKDSLGGKTKTCIVGTVSSAVACLDETENTLSYTNKAQLIKNKPEKIQVSKKERMQMVSNELMKVKQDIEAATSREGILLSRETYTEMTSQLQELKSQLKIAKEGYAILSERYKNHMEIFQNLSDDFNEKMKNVMNCKPICSMKVKYLVKN